MKPGVEILARMLTMTAQKNVKLLVKLMTRETMCLRKKQRSTRRKAKKKTNLGRTQAKKENKTKLETSMESLQRGLREVAFSNRKVFVIKEKCNTVKKGSLIMKGEEKRGNVS